MGYFNSEVVKSKDILWDDVPKTTETPQKQIETPTDEEVIEEVKKAENEGVI